MTKNRDGLENSNHWETPPWLYDQLNKEFNFDFDPCPIRAEFDGLNVEWGERNYINPPYDRVNKPLFIQRAYDEWKKGKTCVLLLPSSTGTKQFHNLILGKAEIRFFKGRISFIGYNTKGIWTESNKGKHDSMLVIFRPGTSSTKITSMDNKPK